MLAEFPCRAMVCLKAIIADVDHKHKGLYDIRFRFERDIVFFLANWPNVWSPLVLVNPVESNWDCCALGSL